MAVPGTTLYLEPEFFGEKEKLLVRHATLSAYTFRYESGVCALRLENELGQLITLPFQGQQIWSAEFGGRNLTMKSMFDEPNATRTYLENYGGFMLHCGATAMGLIRRTMTIFEAMIYPTEMGPFLRLFFLLE